MDLSACQYFYCSRKKVPDQFSVYAALKQLGRRAYLLTNIEIRYLRISILKTLATNAAP